MFSRDFSFSYPALPECNRGRACEDVSGSEGECGRPAHEGSELASSARNGLRSGRLLQSGDGVLQRAHDVGAAGRLDEDRAPLQERNTNGKESVRGTYVGAPSGRRVLSGPVMDGRGWESHAPAIAARIAVGMVGFEARRHVSHSTGA